MKRAANSREITAAVQMIGEERSAAILHEELHLGSVLGARKSKCRRIADWLLHGLFRWLSLLSRYFWGKNNEGSWGVSACERCSRGRLSTPLQ